MHQSTPDSRHSENAAALPKKKRGYFSAAMHERKQRLLSVTRTMIDEGGIENFTIRDVCRRARVAQGTLYTTFQGKDRLIALAIRDIYGSGDDKLRYQTRADTLEGIVDRLIAVNRRSMASRNSMLAITSLYFSHKIGDEVRATLRDMVVLNQPGWLQRVEDAGELAPWVARKTLASNFANIEYSIVQDWARMWIPDNEFLDRLVVAQLSLVVGATTGKTHEQARGMLERITRSSAGYGV